VSLTDIDRNILKRCLAEEPGAWRDFVDRFLGLFIHVITHSAQSRSVRISQSDLDDLCSEIFLSLLSNDYEVLRRFRGKSSLATYLAVISRRIAVRELDRRRKAEALGHVNVQNDSLKSARADATDFNRMEDRDEVRNLLRELPDRDAEVVRQYHLEGKSYREISSQLGIPENSIGPTLSRAREMMRRKHMHT